MRFQDRKIIKNFRSHLLLEAQRLASVLRQKEKRLVLAESCTGGMVAATLTGMPGISEYFCGSNVTYRDATKSAWLGVSPRHLKSYGAVNQKTAILMAQSVLNLTPEADLAGAITGHLGPGARRNEDGLLFMSVVMRGASKKDRPFIFVNSHRLHEKEIEYIRTTRTVAHQKHNRLLRLQRQVSASHSLMLMVRSLLEFTEK